MFLLRLIWPVVRALFTNRADLVAERYCQVEVIGAWPAHQRLTWGLVRHTSPRSKQRMHEPAVSGSWPPATGGVRHGRDSG